MPIINIAYESA